MGANGSQSHIHDPPYSDGSFDRIQSYAPRIALPSLLRVPRLMKLQEKPFGLMVPNIMVPKMGKGALGLVDLSIEVLVCLAKGARMKAVGIFHARIKAKLAV